MQAGSIVNEDLGLRRTGQRQLIQEILQQAGRHLAADEIYNQARDKSYGISLSTIYRNLQLFKKLGLIEEHQFGTHRCYEPTSRAKHHHLVCLGCGQVFEFKCPLTEGLKSTINKEEGFRVTETEVRLLGYCPKCQKYLNTSVNEN